MGVIFVASTDLGSAAHTSRIIDPILRFLFHDSLTLATRDEIHFLVRKTAHLTEYAILGALLWNAFAAQAHRPEPGAPGPAWPPFAALAVAALYASSDEFHQTFVSSRTASVRDVMIDTTGAALGLSILWLWRLWRASVARNQAGASAAPG